MKKVVCFGEIMARLNPEGYLRLKQAKKLEISYAGGEANVAVSLCNYGLNASFVTKLPDNDIAKAAKMSLMQYGVDTANIVHGGDRMGIYFVEKGASQRASKVIYDRSNSSIACAKPNDFDWNNIFKDAEWFHFTGITPALSDSAAKICIKACEAAKKMGVRISCDLNYRNKLWSCEKAQHVMSELMEFVDVCIMNEEDADKVFGIKAKDTNVSGGKLSCEGYKEVAKEVAERFNIKTVAITLRGSISASDNNWAGVLYQDNKCYFSKNYLIHIVDRVGGGDSFAGALIYAIMEGYPLEEVIEFAVAASCLKHTIEHDFNQVSATEVRKLMMGEVTGRVER